MGKTTIAIVLTLAALATSCAPTRRACERNYGPFLSEVEYAVQRDTLIRIAGDTVRVVLEPRPLPDLPQDTAPDLPQDTATEYVIVKEPFPIWRNPEVIRGKGNGKLKYEQINGKIYVECVCDTIERVIPGEKQLVIKPQPLPKGVFLLTWWQCAVIFFLGVLVAMLLRYK